MKTYLLYTLIIGAFCFLLFTSESDSSSGSPGGKTGSPGDGGITCAQCHSGLPVSTVPGWITTNIPPTGYVPGTVYTITATGTHTGVVKFGFEMTAESNSAIKVGTFAITNPSETKLTNLNKAVTHTSAGTIPSGNMKTWSANWTAPAAGTGNVSFYGAFNAANGNGSTSGDKIYKTSLSIPEHVPTDFNLNLTAFLEGPFNGIQMSTGMNSNEIVPLTQPYNIPPWNYNGIESVPAIPNADVVDWLLVELRDAASAPSAASTTAFARQAAFILSNGSVVGMDGSSPLSFDHQINLGLFAVVWHRNHLGIISSVPLIKTGSTYNFDFTLTGQAYNNGQNELIQGVWGMISADADSDGVITISDLAGIWNQEAGQSGYKISDFNLDAHADNKDKNDKWFPNLNKTTQVP